jgi:hypothetical protein
MRVTAQGLQLLPEPGDLLLQLIRAPQVRSGLLDEGLLVIGGLSLVPGLIGRAESPATGPGVLGRIKCRKWHYPPPGIEPSLFQLDGISPDHPFARATFMM